MIRERDDMGDRLVMKKSCNNKSQQIKWPQKIKSAGPFGLFISSHHFVFVPPPPPTVQCTYTIQVRGGIRQKENEQQEMRERNNKSMPKKRFVSECLNYKSADASAAAHTRTSSVPMRRHDVSRLAHSTAHSLFAFKNNFGESPYSFFRHQFCQTMAKLTNHAVVFFFFLQGEDGRSLFFFLSRPGRPPPCHATGRK